MEDKNKKKFWNAQIKSMIGPCMITFAIPLTIPGVTITVVAFSKDDVFTLYGFWHLLGLGFLAFSIILLILGCILRIAWQPFIGPDLEMQLSPNPSFASIRNKVGDCDLPRSEKRSIYTGNMKEEKLHSESFKPDIKNKKQDNHNNRKNDKHDGVNNSTNHHDGKIEVSVHDKDTSNLKDNTTTNTNIKLLQNDSSPRPNKRQQVKSSTDENEITSATEILKTNSGTTIMTPRQRTPHSLEPIDSSYSHGQDLFSVGKQALELDEIQKWRNKSKKKKLKATNNKSGNTEITTQCTKDTDSDRYKLG